MSDRLERWGRLAPLALIVILAVASVVSDLGWLRFRSVDGDSVSRVERTLDRLPGRPLVLVAFDPDLGTYAEIRPTVRALLAELLRREARLALVSLTPEGRALLIAELERLGRGNVNPRRLLDLGFVPGAEAAVVRLARGPITVEGGGDIATRLSAEGAEALDALVVVGGNDLGPRTWIEQFLPRIDVPLVAVAPTVLLPELQPYLAGGQLDAMLATPRDGAAYRASLDLENLARFADEREPSSVALLLGLLVAIAVLGQGLVGRLASDARDARLREPS